MMAIAVVGAGAMGGLWAARLSLAGHAVTIVDPSAPLIEAVRRDGLALIEGDDTVRTAHPDAHLAATEAAAMDIVFLFVKGPHTRAAAASLGPLVGPSTTVVTIQNGWGNADVLAQRVPAEQLVVGVTYESATIVAPGRILHGGSGLTTLGPYVDGGDTSLAAGVAEVMADAGFAREVDAAVRTPIWRKLIHNAACLPVSALTGLRAAELVEDAAWRGLIDDLAREATAVARAAGHDIDPDERIARIHAVLGGAGLGVPSMLADVQARRPTEIDTINGAVVRAADEHGVSVPGHVSMVALIEGLERSWHTEREQA